MRRLIRIDDTRLRDGTQGDGVSFAPEDTRRIAARLDAVDLRSLARWAAGLESEGFRFFRRVPALRAKQARVAAFRMTRRPGVSAAPFEVLTGCALSRGTSHADPIEASLVGSIEDRLRQDERQSRRP